MTQDEINAVKKAAGKMRKQESAQDEIIEMARQAGFMMENSAAIQAAEIFAKLVAAKLFNEKKHWIGLTDEEHNKLAVDWGCLSADWILYAAAVERAVKEKNT